MQNQLTCKNIVGKNILHISGGDCICSALGSKINVEDYSHLRGLELADFDSCDASNDNIDILVGADYYWDIVSGEIIQWEKGPTAVTSKLGWLLSGRSTESQFDSRTVNNLILAGECFDNSRVQTEGDDLTASLQCFWKTESIAIESPEADRYPEKHNFVRNLRFTGEYEVG